MSKTRLKGQHVEKTFDSPCAPPKAQHKQVVGSYKEVDFSLIILTWDTTIIVTNVDLV